LIAVVVVQVYLCSTVFDWWSSASFSQRRLVSMTYPLIVGLASLLVAGARLAARAKVPRWGRHVIAGVGLGWLVWWNLALVFPLRGGKPANDSVHPMCCDRVPPPMSWIARPVYRAIGNPFALPASAWFAIRHGVPLARWDQAAGTYALVPGLDDLTDGSYVQKARSVWNLGGGPGIEPWLLDGLGPSQQVAGAPVGNARRLVGGDARVLVPALLPDAEHVVWWLRGPGHAVVRWNGDTVVDRELPDAWTPVAFDVPEDTIAVGMNTIELDAPAGTWIGKMELSFAP
jgi:hypothetical protein